MRTFLGVVVGFLAGVYLFHAPSRQSIDNALTAGAKVLPKVQLQFKEVR